MDICVLRKNLEEEKKYLDAKSHQTSLTFLPPLKKFIKCLFGFNARGSLHRLPLYFYWSVSSRMW